MFYTWAFQMDISWSHHWCWILQVSPIGVPLAPQPHPQKSTMELLNHTTDFHPFLFDWPWILKQQKRSVVCFECKVQRVGGPKNLLWAEYGVFMRPTMLHIAEFNSKYKINNDYVAFTSSKESRIWKTSVLSLSLFFPIAEAQTQGCAMPARHMLCSELHAQLQVLSCSCDHLDLTFKTLKVANYRV